MFTVLVFVITLAILIFVHELGHFLVARRNGIRADEFGFGFPPRIFGIQFLSGKKLKKIAEKENIDVQISSYQTEKTEFIKETVIDKVQEIDQIVPEKKWRFIWGKRDTEEEIENKDNLKEGTIYSLNWIPLGGFVKIKGEDGKHNQDEDSFSKKSAWIRIKVLGAGIMMNFVLAWAVISFSYFIGAPQAIEDNQSGKDLKIQIAQIVPESPAEKMGLKIGDEIIKCELDNQKCRENFTTISEVQNIINEYKEQEIILKIKRGKEFMEVRGIPRSEYPENQGPVGILLVRTAMISHPWYESIYKGLLATLDLIWLIIWTFFNIIKDLIIGQKVSVDVSGPVGIAYLTKQVTDLGFSYILQFVALLSINLGIINGFPFPALDGGRILFILIEKIKGSPVSQKVEQFAHTFGFIALIALMVIVTFRDVIRFEIFDKIKNLF